MTGATHEPAKKGEEKDFFEAMGKELNSFKENCVLSPLSTETQNSNTAIPAIWVLTWKLSGKIRKPKARLCVQGFKDVRTDLQTYSGTPSVEHQRIACLYGVSRHWKLAYTDVKTAPMKAESNVLVRLPKLLPPGDLAQGYIPGRVYSANKMIYGLCDSPIAFKNELTKVMAREEYYTTTQADSIYIKTDGNNNITSINIAYVDDIQCWSMNPMFELEKI
eukprot:GHVR01130149.1.p1 GENE.GHVR01130149.1~~GHVR01130149.1.p1  ORF type:complete len:220 (-),score=20.21 GHVR01130149.1:615-1274(-)